MLKIPKKLLLVACMVVFVLGSQAWAGVNHEVLSGAHQGLAHELHKPVSSGLVETLRRASNAGLNFVVKPAKGGLKAISGPKTSGENKLSILYIGAEFCPYCAMQRWGLVLTLLRFGKFSGLRYMLSSPTDIYPNTPTFTFTSTHYASRYIDFSAVEIIDRGGHRLMDLNKMQSKIFDTYDAPPFRSSKHGVPFVYVDGRFIFNALMLPPKDIKDKNWQQVASSLADQHSRLFKNVMPEVNLMTAAICQIDGGDPVMVCTSPGVVAAKEKWTGNPPGK